MKRKRTHRTKDQYQRHIIIINDILHLVVYEVLIKPGSGDTILEDCRIPAGAQLFWECIFCVILLESGRIIFTMMKLVKKLYLPKYLSEVRFWGHPVERMTYPDQNSKYRPTRKAYYCTRTQTKVWGMAEVYWELYWVFLKDPFQTITRVSLVGPVG